MTGSRMFSLPSADVLIIDGGGSSLEAAVVVVVRDTYYLPQPPTDSEADAMQAPAAGTSRAWRRMRGRARDWAQTALMSRLKATAWTAAIICLPCSRPGWRSASSSAGSGLASFSFSSLLRALHRRHHRLYLLLLLHLHQTLKQTSSRSPSAFCPLPSTTLSPPFSHPRIVLPPPPNTATAQLPSLRTRPPFFCLSPPIIATASPLNPPT